MNDAVCNNITIEDSGGNVFADIGCKDADEKLAKADIAINICRTIKKQKLTQKEAASLLGIDQPAISKLMKGQLSGFSTDRLFKFLNALNVDIVIELRPAAPRHSNVTHCGRISVIAF